jgi:hypothetical protein
MTTDDTNRILSRVRKMMALANDAGATEGERDNALRAAHATLAKYNLDMAQVEAATGTKEEGREMQADSYLGRPWARVISLSIAQLYFCHYFSSGKGRTVKHVFVGRTSNCITAKEMSKFIVEAVYKEASKYGRSMFEGGEGASARAFATGAAHRIYDRCEKLRKEAEAPKATGTALVLANVYQLEAVGNQDFLKAKGVVLIEGKASKRSVRSQGFARGQVYGEGVSLHGQVGGTPRGRLT